jgi:hypothetical protein
MTLTIEIPEAIERAAARRQTDVSVFVLSAATKEAERETQSETPQSEAERRRAAAYAGLGCLSNQGMSVDDFLAERHAVAQFEAEAQNQAGATQ